MNSEIAIYIGGKYAKASYKSECHNVRTWPGLSVICHELTLAGHEVGTCSLATVHNCKIILVSITSACDWWPFLRERVRWRQGGYKVIVGGAGVLNVRPFLPYADYFVLGRGESIIVSLVDHVLKGKDYRHESVVSGGKVSGEYRLCQTRNTYPHKIALSDGSLWKEDAVGCKRRCLFCGYTWQRKTIGDLYSVENENEGFGGKKNREYSFFNLEGADLSALRIIGLDGFSERLRRSVNKPITRGMLRGFFETLLESEVKPHEVKMYNIVGLPTETTNDWKEFKTDLKASDTGEEGKQWKIVLHNTPFRAMPATPSALWPMSYREYRGRIAKVLKDPKNPGNVFFQGKRFWALESMGTDSLSTVALDAIALRGVESDQNNVDKLVRSAKFWSANSRTKTATLERHFDVRRLFGAYSAKENPTAYLLTYCKPLKNAT